MSSLFKPRQFDSDSLVTGRSFLADSTTEVPNFASLANTTAYTGTELTKNDKYCVSKLPALPPVLATTSAGSEILNGYVDNATKCSLVLSEHAINVWPHNSTDILPLTFEFPLDESADEAMQLAILTLPAPGTTLDPGLVIINSMAGNVRFYESVQHAPALGLINSKLIETSISLGQGEYITLAENVEPAGIVVATSWRRVVLVLLRDYKGAPNLSTLELISPSKSSRFLGWLGSQGDEITDDIVSVKLGRISNHGSTQEIVVQDAAGTFKLFLFQSSSTGAPFIDRRRTILYKLSSYLVNNIDGFIPGSVFDIKFLDLWPLLREDVDIYTALVCVQSSMQGVDEKKLLLLTLKINSSGVMVFGSHQLPDLSNPTSSKPRLYIPKPGTTAFVIVGNSVILADLNTVNKPTAPGFLYYEPKWEDVINFKSSVQIIGSGYEDGVAATSNPSLVLITKGYGVLRIERFEDTEAQKVEEEGDPTDPVYILKSHIQQAVFYHESAALDFDVSAEYPVDIATQATTAVVSEILDSTSAYLPPLFSSTRDSFALRIELMMQLIDYVKRNFDNCWFAVLPEIVEALEKLKVALNLWTFVDADTQEAQLLKIRLTRIIKEKKLAGHGKDVVRSFFTYGVSNILIVLTDLVETLFNENSSLPSLIKILKLTLHDAVFVTEQKYIAGVPEIPPLKFWIFNTKLLITAEEVYTKTFCENSKDFQYLNSHQGRQDLSELTETLYYLVTAAIQYMQDTENDQLEGYLEWYNLRKGAWVGALLKYGLSDQAMTITEKYHDFFSLAAVLDKEREQRSPEFIQEKIDEFINRYGYLFASKLFDYYIRKDKLQNLLEFEHYQELLEQYFRSNPRNSNCVAWIHHLLHKNFTDAANVLMSLSSAKETDNQEAREFNYSLAKLSAVAAKFENPDSVDVPVLDEITVDAENNLVVIRIQNKLHHTILQYVQGKRELVNFAYFVESFCNSNIPHDDLFEAIEPFFQRFVDQKPLSKEQLITLLSSIAPKPPFTKVFADALIVASLISNDKVFHQQASEVWQKLLVFTDDWRSLSDTSDNTDEVNKMKIRDTALFSTVFEVRENREIMDLLDEVVKSARIGDQRTEVGRLLETLLDSTALGLWIETVKAEAR